MTETFLTILPSLIVSITGFIAIFIRQEKTRKEITNSHPTHLRDDMDDKHNEILEQNKEIQTDLESFQNRVEKRFEEIISREAIIFNQIGAIENNASAEHRNLWKEIAKLRTQKRRFIQ